MIRLFGLYLFVSYTWASFSLCVSDSVILFNYHLSMECVDIIPYLPMVLIPLLFVTADRRGPQSTLKIYLPYWKVSRSEVYLLIVVVLFLGNMLNILSDVNISTLGERGIGRVFEGKIYWIYFIMILILISRLQKTNLILTNTILLLICFTAFLYAWIDGSRKSILLMLCFVFLPRNKVNFWSVIFVLIYCVFLIYISESSRAISNKSLHFILVELKNQTTNLTPIKYMTEFSVINFLFMVKSIDTPSGVAILKQITPLPSSLIGEADWEYLMFDAYRPISGLAALARVNYFLPYVFLIFILYRLKYIGKNSSAKYAKCAGGVYVVAFIISMQYSLRLTFILVWAALFIEISGRLLHWRKKT